MTDSVVPAQAGIQGGADSREGDHPALFISDLHLDRQRPDAVALFQRFMRDIAPASAALYILGDFFETWVGDDDITDPFHGGIVATLRALSDSGVPVFFLPGNRDFLAGTDFASAAGLTPLPDPARIDLFGTPTLLSHGDIFCTDDVSYQRFRSQVRDPAWQAEFLARPLQERHAQARALRERSEQSKAGKQPEIMDVNASAVSRLALDMDVRRIIHGHTHRPARHEFRVADRIVERWVLPDWYETGGYLRCDAEGCLPVGFAAGPG